MSSYAGGTDQHPGGMFMAGGVDWASGKDFSVSIKGLKAIQREARSATAALKHLESLETKICSMYGVPAELLKSDADIRSEYQRFKENCLFPGDNS